MIPRSVRHKHTDACLERWADQTEESVRGVDPGYAKQVGRAAIVMNDRAYALWCNRLRIPVTAR